MKKRIKTYYVPAAIALAFAVGIGISRDLPLQPDFSSVCGVLSDCFFIPGIVLTGLGLLSRFAAKGQYDAFGYVFSKFSLHSIIPGSVRSMNERPQSLYDYKARKDEKGRAWKPQTFYVGVVCIVISVVFLILYSL